MKSFKFQIVWLFYAYFGNLVQDSWRNNENYVEAIEEFKHTVMG